MKQFEIADFVAQRIAEEEMNHGEPLRVLLDGKPVAVVNAVIKNHNTDFKIAPDVAAPIETYHEDLGDVLWWFFPVVEPPYVGTPNDEHFPDYVTHFTKITVPVAPENEV